MLAAGLPLVPMSAVAAEADRAPLVAPPGPPPGPIPLADRRPVLSIPDENGVRDPQQVELPLPARVALNQPPSGAKSLPTQGGPSFNVFGVGPDRAAHLAQVFTQQVNEREPDGAWTDVRSHLDPEPGYGWQATVGGVTSHFPTTLSASTPVRVDLGSGVVLSVVPEGVDPSVAGRAAHGAVTYANALPQTDLVYRPALGGYKEDVILKTPQANAALSYLIDAPGLSLRTTPTGDVEVVSAGTAVARIQRPLVFDSSPDPATSIGSLDLHDLGTGRYRLEVAVDGTFLAKATYPVTVDPGAQQITVDTADTYVHSANPNTDYSSSGGLFAQGGSPTYRAFVRFNTTGLSRPGRLVYDATLFLYATSGPKNAPMVDASRVTSAWPAPLTWNTQPTVGAVIASKNCPSASCRGWMTWQMKSMYQHVLDPANPDPWTDHGIRMSTTSTTYYGFYSGNGLAPPVLQVSYNDLPDAPNQSFPRDDYVSENDSPTLKIGAIPSDPNGDEVLVQYQLSDDPNDFTGSHLIWESPWTDERSYVVPSGILVDGQTYHWRARSWDICAQPDGMCSLTDGQGVVRQQNASATRALSIVLKHFGDDDRWAMWSHDLGNGMTAKVNQANGNLFLDLPLDTLATAVGDLSAGLSYNSQQNADLGLTPGWDLAIGPRSSARDLPKELVKLGDPSDFPDAGVKVRLGGGRAVYFPHRERRVFASVGPGSGVIKQNADGTFLYTTSDGSTYTFKASGKLIEANPASSQLSSGANSLDYTFNASEQLTQVTDPKGRSVTVTWSSGRPSSISTWAGQTWDLSYSGGHLSSVSVSVTNPSTLPSPTTVTETIGLSYDGNGLLSEIDDGVTSAANRTGWVVSYLLDPRGNYRVSTITAPGGGAPSAPTPWTFEYQGPYYGSTASTTCVTDPLVSPAAQFCTGAHQAKVDFNTAGLAIRIAGPADQTGYWPVTTMAWDSNNNLLCKRTPAANAASEITDPTACKNDARSTRWTYNNDAPFQMLTHKHPAPGSTGTGARLLESYQYDSDTAGANYNGLWVEKYGNKDFTGVPADEAVWSNMDANWGTGTPPGVPGPGDNWSMRWSGLLDVSSWSAARRAAFRVTTADEGVTLIVGNTALLDCVGTTQPAGTYNCGSNQDKTKKLWPGLRPITIEYAELSGDASFKLEWDQGNGTWQVIPANRLQTNMGLLTKTTTKDAAAATDLLKTVYSFPDDDSKARHLPDSVTVTDVAAAVERRTAYTYNQYGQATTITTAAGTALAATTTNTYTNDATTSCLTQVTGPTGGVTTFTCNPAGDVTSATQVVRAVPGTNQSTEQNRITTTQYDSLGRLTKVTPPSGGYTITSYDRAGRAVNLDRYLGTGAGHDTHAYTDLTYDDAGHLLTERLPQVRDPASGQMVRPTTTHTYDWLDDETERVDVRNKTWTYSYDASRRLIQTTSPSGLVSRTEYRLSTAPSGGTYKNEVTAWSPPGDPQLPGTVATVSVLNLLGQMTSEKVGSLTATTYTYDVLGNTTKITAPSGIRTDYTYNAFGQVTQRKDFAQGASAATTTSTYDAAGRLRTVDGPRTNADDSVTYDYDAADRLVGATQNGITLPGAGSPGVTTSYVWDDASERVKVSHPMSTTQTMIRNWTFDTSGRMASYADARGTTTYSHGAGDFLESVADPRGITLSFEHDNLGRRTRRYGTSGAQVQDDQTFAFDLAGNMVSATVVGAGTIGIDYDDDGRVWKTYQQSPTPTTTYAYHPSTGRLASVADPAGTTSYTYTANGQVYQLTEPFSTTPVTYTYDTAGRITKRTDGAGLCWTQTYEATTGRPDLRTIRVNGSSCNSTVLGTFDLGYDPASNVTSRAETIKTETGANNPDSGTWTYAYDGAGRMTSSTAPSTTVTTYGYDGAGNRTSLKVGAGSPVTTSFDGAGLPTSSSDGTAFTHDAVGDLTAIDRSGTNDWYFAYDSWGNLRVGGRTPVGSDVTYSTDALDRVLSREESGTSTTYTYRGAGEDAARIQVGAGTPVYHAFTNSGPLATRTGTDSATLRYYLRDWHSDVVAVAATSGTNRVKGSILYSPWGEPGARTGEMSTSPAQGYLGFQGDLTDVSTGQVDMLTRYYEPSLGRFTKRDVLFGNPQEPHTLNQFAYAEASPITFADPTGMMIVGEGGGWCKRSCNEEPDEEPVFDVWTAPTVWSVHGIPVSAPDSDVATTTRWFMTFLDLMSTLPAKGRGVGPNTVKYDETLWGSSSTLPREPGVAQANLTLEYKGPKYGYIISGNTTYSLEPGTTVWSTSYKIYTLGSDSPAYVSRGRAPGDNKAFLLTSLENNEGRFYGSATMPAGPYDSVPIRVDIVQVRSGPGPNGRMTLPYTVATYEFAPPAA
jgi:RHS repeat-associated protein